MGFKRIEQVLNGCTGLKRCRDPIVLTAIELVVLCGVLVGVEEPDCLGDRTVLVEPVVALLRQVWCPAKGPHPELSRCMVRTGKLDEMRPVAELCETESILERRVLRSKVDLISDGSTGFSGGVKVVE